MSLIFGVRSPLVVEIQETLNRCGVEVKAGISVNGIPRTIDALEIVTLDGRGHDYAGQTFIACAFSPERREQLVEMALALGLLPMPALIDPSTILARSVRVGHGSFLNAGVIVGAVSAIEDHVLVNRGASIGHHCLISDFVSIGPGATLAGNVHVGTGAMIGAGATILPDIRIGKNAIIAAGSLVRKHVTEGSFVAGNPALERPFNRQGSSLHVDDGE